MAERIHTHKGLRVYQNAMDAAMEIFSLTKTFPTEEKYSMVDQIRRSSRSVCANIAEAWRKRRYQAAFVAKLNDAESEASETQVWLELAQKCNYLSIEVEKRLDAMYDHIIGQLIRMIDEAEKWIVKSS
jgi:four helix bundle protein